MEERNCPFYTPFQPFPGNQNFGRRQITHGIRGREMEKTMIYSRYTHVYAGNLLSQSNTLRDGVIEKLELGKF
jgi:hypothetical protein